LQAYEEFLTNFSFQFPWLTAKKKGFTNQIHYRHHNRWEMDEAIWETAPDATDFIIVSASDNGTPILEGRKLSRHLRQ
jgi:hypothetical protein